MVQYAGHTEIPINTTILVITAQNDIENHVGKIVDKREVFNGKIVAGFESEDGIISDLYLGDVVRIMEDGIELKKGAELIL